MMAKKCNLAIIPNERGPSIRWSAKINILDQPRMHSDGGLGCRFAEYFYTVESVEAKDPDKIYVCT